ncbi:acyl-CoA N-acyltransferase [Trichoderma austrokoningii]
MPTLDSSSSVTVRPSTSLSEVNRFFCNQIRDLGWNRHELDAPTHLTVAQNGQDWLLLIPAGANEPVGMVIGFKFPNITRWAGFFIVDKQYQGRGWGGTLFKAMLDTYNETGIQMVGLDAVKEQVKTYERRGFVEAAKIKIMTRIFEPELATKYGAVQLTEGYKAVDIKEVDAGSIADLDRMHTGLDRRVLWAKASFSRPDAFGHAIISTATEELSGFILVRHCEHGHQFGPLLADSNAHASCLLQLAMSHPSVTESSGSLIAEVFGPNENSVDVFSHLGWQWTKMDYHRMWLNDRVPEEQQGGRGQKGNFAIFDASEG